jgi:starch synthase
LTAQFSARKPAGRWKNRAAMFKGLELDEDNSAAVFATFVEASEGRGIDVLLGSLDRLLADGKRLVLLGEVAEQHIMALEVARRKHRGRFTHLAEFDDKLARLTLAGADVFLVPGAVEPKVTWLRRALRYGTIPLALQCGGLFQIVRDWEPSREMGNGFVFYAATIDGLVDAGRRVSKTLGDEAQKTALRVGCLGMEFSKEAAARGHEALYERLLGIQKSVRAA